MADDVMFDVRVLIKPLWKRAAADPGDAMFREQTETRFLMLSDEIRRMVCARLEQMWTEQGDNVHLWTGFTLSAAERDNEARR